jgi:hypothetical protein
MALERLKNVDRTITQIPNEQHPHAASLAMFCFGPLALNWRKHAAAEREEDQKVVEGGSKEGLTEYVRQRCRRGSSSQLEDEAQIARPQRDCWDRLMSGGCCEKWNRRTDESVEDKRRRYHHVSGLVKRLILPEESLDDFPTHERLERERCKHVGSKLRNNHQYRRRTTTSDTLTQARAMLMRVSSVGKLLRMFPCVLSVKTRYPEVDMHRQAMTEMMVDTCVTWAKRSSVGVLSEP